MLPGGDGFQRDRRVRVRRGGDGDRVDTGQGERVGERGARVRNVEARGAFRRLRRIPSDECERVEPGGAQRAEVRDAAEPRPDDRNARLIHRGNLGSDLASTHEERSQLGPVGTKVVFENEQVRVWVLRLAPGERSAVHQHDLDHLLIQIRGDRIAVEPEPDADGPHRDYMEADVIPGHGRARAQGRDRDRGERRCRAVLRGHRGAEVATLRSLASARHLAVGLAAWWPRGSSSFRTGAVSGR